MNVFRAHSGCTWRTAVFGWCLLAWLPAQQDAAFVEVVGPAEASVVDQPIEVMLRIGYDRDFFARQAVPIVQRPIDVPLQIVVPWLAGDDRQLVDWAEAPVGPRLIVGEHVVRCAVVADRQRDGRTFAVVELRCQWTGLAADAHELSAAVRYAYASAFEESLLGGRQPLDRHEATVVGAVFRHDVRELPSSGQPAGFGGAVGQFTAQATASVSTVEVGDAFTLALSITGFGNLQRFAAPAWPTLPGFVVQGLAERTSSGGRRFEFDVVALQEGALLGPVPFSFFAVKSNRYETVLAQPPALQVIARDPSRPLSARLARLLEPPAGAAVGLGWWFLAATPVAVLLAILLWFARARRAR